MRTLRSAAPMRERRRQPLQAFGRLVRAGPSRVPGARVAVVDAIGFGIAAVVGRRGAAVLRTALVRVPVRRDAPDRMQLAPAVLGAPVEPPRALQPAVQT